MQKKGNKGRKKKQKTQNYPLVEDKKEVDEEIKRRVIQVHWTRREHVVPISTECGALNQALHISKCLCHHTKY